jgi:hypothetical protein
MKNYYQHVLMTSRPSLFLIKNQTDYLDTFVIIILALISIIIISLPILDHVTSNNKLVNHGIVHAIESMSVSFNFVIVLILDLLARLMLYGSFGVKVVDESNTSEYSNLQITAIIFYSIYCCFGFLIIFLELNMEQGNINFSRNTLTQYRVIQLLIKIVLPIIGNLMLEEKLNIYKYTVCIIICLYFCL